mmetsp:Transcript_68043/g.148303  ORF Transcript_68043/g.148303 Transcript_68043/m.148303 type:complete len:336 (-) Transcript_68043:161-1168(-)
MYNGIGLLTPKGSGTNGYVQRNLSSLKAQRADWVGLKGQFKAENVIKIKKANPELLLHEQKRKVELELLKLEDELRETGAGDDEIEELVNRERKSMLSAVEDGSLRYDSELEKKDSHALALEKEKEMARFEKAFNINKEAHVPGAVFDQDLQAKEKIERMQQRAEQERLKLLAAKKAEKAEAKAEKLRKKAEKAKKKADKKLEKLRAKQEKKKQKEEAKAAEQAVKGEAEGKKKKDEGKDKLMEVKQEKKSQKEDARAAEKAVTKEEDSKKKKKDDAKRKQVEDPVVKEEEEQVDNKKKGKPQKKAKKDSSSSGSSSSSSSSPSLLLLLLRLSAF